MAHQTPSTNRDRATLLDVGSSATRSHSGLGRWFAAALVAGCASTLVVAADRPSTKPTQQVSERPNRDVALARDPEVDDTTEAEFVPFGESRLSAASLKMMAEGSVLALPSAAGPVRMRLIERVTTYLGSTVLSFEGDPSLGSRVGAEARLAIVDGIVGGFIRPHDGFIVTMDGMEGDTQRLSFRAVAADDGADHPDCIVPPQPKSEPKNGEGGIAGGCVDPGSLQDVLIVITPTAVDAVGGPTQAKVKIEAAIHDANVAFKNSSTANRLRLVGIYVYDFPESGDIATDLDHLREPEDGSGDFVHTLRALYHADLVQLIAVTSGACGIANLFADDPAFGFSVVASTCLDDYVPAHEIGHNFGCCHAVGDGGGCEGGGYFPFSNGHRFFGNDGEQYRTVMAYDPGERIAHFSNPNISYQGKATGIPGSTSASADNARTIDLTALAVANFECDETTEPDCNINGIPDLIDVTDGLSEDCNSNGIPDECDIGSGISLDENGDGVPDECASIPTKIFAEDSDDNTTLDAFGISAAIGRGLVPVGQTLPLNAVIGSHTDDAEGNNAGAAYAFSSVGAQQAKLVASDAEAGANFGWAVDSWGYIPTGLVPKREFAVVGAYRADDGSDTDAGKVYVFSSDNDAAWLERKILTAADSKANDWFGFSVNMTRVPADTNHLLFVGAPQGNNGKGAVYIYRYLDANTTTLSKKLILPLSTEGADFGWSLASDNFVTLVTTNPPSILQRAILAVGAPGFGDDVGRVRTFERAVTSNTTFPSTGANVELGPNEAVAGDRFGEAIALVDNWLAVGAPGRNGLRGAVFIYERTNLNTWALRQTFTLSDGKPGDRFGASVSMTVATDGSIWLAAGAPRFDVQGPTGPLIDAGRVVIRRKPANSTTWLVVNENLPTDRQPGDQFGTACSIYNNAGALRALITSPFDDDNGLNSGSAYYVVPTLP